MLNHKCTHFIHYIMFVMDYILFYDRPKLFVDGNLVHRFALAFAFMVAFRTFFNHASKKYEETRRPPTVWFGGESDSVPSILTDIDRSPGSDMCQNALKRSTLLWEGPRPPVHLIFGHVQIFLFTLDVYLRQFLWVVSNTKYCRSLFRIGRTAKKKIKEVKTQMKEKKFEWVSTLKAFDHSLFENYFLRIPTPPIIGERNAES